MSSSENQSDLFWTVDSQSVNIFFDEFKHSVGFDDFKFKYSWSHIPEIEDYLKRLFYSSYSNDKDMKELPEMIHNVEEFFASLIDLRYLTRRNIKRIMTDLKDEDNGFRIIEQLHDKNSFSNSEGDKIQINLDINSNHNSPLLTNEEFKRLSLFNEMCHKIMRFDRNEDLINTYTDTLDSMLRSKGINNPDTEYKETVFNGFLMIEDCLAQELAEELTYDSCHKERPKYKNKIEIGSLQKSGFETVEVSTNLDYHRLYQQPTIEFGKTLRGCHTDESKNEDILSRMIIKSLNFNFVDEVIREFNHGDGNKYQDLFLMLRTMGLLHIQKNASIGNGQTLYGILSNNCIETMNFLSKKNIELRPYPFGGFPKVDFASHIIKEEVQVK